jgi:hypothetical protein
MRSRGSGDILLCYFYHFYSTFVSPREIKYIFFIIVIRFEKSAMAGQAAAQILVNLPDYLHKTSEGLHELNVAGKETFDTLGQAYHSGAAAVKGITESGKAFAGQVVNQGKGIFASVKGTLANTVSNIKGYASNAMAVRSVVGANEETVARLDMMADRDDTPMIEGSGDTNPMWWWAMGFLVCIIIGLIFMMVQQYAIGGVIMGVGVLVMIVASTIYFYRK